MMIDASAVRYAQKMLAKGYGYQNASRIAGVSETTLRALTGGAIAKPAVEPLRPREACARTEREPAQVLDHAAVDLSGPARVIVHGVARKYGLKTCDLTGPRQSRTYAYPRHEAMARIREERKLSLPRIGAMFGGRDHTSILHGIRSHNARMAWADALIACLPGQLDLFARAA